MRCLAVLTAVAAGVFFSYAASAKLIVQIDKSTQRMTVQVDGETKHTWPISTGVGTNSTPNGTYRPQYLARSHFSRKYYNAPMPHSVFFHKGWAIHGTTYISRLGGPASHGCVRLHPNNAKVLFALVQSSGVGNTEIVISGANPVRKGPLIAKHTNPKKVATKKQPQVGKTPEAPSMLHWDRLIQRWDRS